MNREALYQQFEIVTKTLDECPKLEHSHMFFELVYIMEGTGKQCINQNKFDYHPGHMFLITPQDCHSFDIETTTTFFFLRFTDIYIKESGLWKDKVEQLEYILQNVSHKPGCILKNQTDKQLVKPMVDAIIREYVNRDLYNRELIEHLVNTMIVVVARNIAKYLPETVGDHTEGKIMDILQYIHKHIYEPDKIRAKTISDEFGISESYLGRYFKKHAEISLQNYITNYRLQLIEHRLKHSDLRIGEIAYSLGFSDESHLNKFFKKGMGMNPLAFRKIHRNSA
ncbi:AraC family transcriptional regulator [Echinicola sp. 20G]|uniref:AraC family transcriptional regulator n=1 Tax=Echinicola sp. 20G TaxID=2781961 RepID=UPI0019111712|nr:AraC family transcriptional regulator [Echinicola sp. 20G]